MSPELVLGAAVVCGLYMAFNIGANDVANAMGTSVGSRAMTLRKAILVAAIFEFAGAFFVGGHVTKTMGTGLLDMQAFEGAWVPYTYGMLAALLSAAAWLNIATLLKLPVSTTHAIVGAVWGFGLIFGGVEVINMDKVVQVVASWFVSPLSGMALAFVLFRVIDKRIFDAARPADSLRRHTPAFVFLVFSILVLSMIYKGLKKLKLHLGLVDSLVISVSVGLLAALVGFALVRRFMPRQYEGRRQEYEAIERVFCYLQILTACYIAFAHGANDVANAIGPLSSIVAVVGHGAISQDVAIPVWVLLLGGAGIVFGLAVLGYKLIETIGSGITEMTPSRGFAATFGAATTVLTCSKLGMPVSTTHTIVGSVIGVGLARGWPALDLRVITQIVVAWFVTVPIAAVLTMVIYKLLLWVAG